MNSDWRVNFGHLCLGIALIIILTKATSALEPYGYYFTFGGTLFGVPKAGVPTAGLPSGGEAQPELLELGVPEIGKVERISFLAILIRYGIPVLVGGIIGFIARENTLKTAGAMAFSAAFILAWPAFNDWGHYADPRVVASPLNLEWPFKFVYVLNCIAYYYLARFGASAIDKYLDFAGQTRAGLLRDMFGWPTVRQGLFGIISIAAGFFLEKVVLAQVFNVQ